VDGFLPTFTRRESAPPGEKGEMLAAPSVRMAPPERVILPLQDLPGDLFSALVASGDRVKAGQPVGITGRQQDGVYVHAGISGEVVAVGPALHPLGHEVQAVTVASDTKDEAAVPRPFNEKGGEDLASFLRSMGIPLEYHRFHRAEMLFINATDFEPCAAAAGRLICEAAEAFASGLAILMSASGCARALVAVDKKAGPFVKDTAAGIEKIPGAAIVLCERPWPETVRVAVNAAKDAESAQCVPASGVMVVDPACVVAVHNACVQGQPFIEQLITVAGSGVPSPHNLWVRVGTPIGSIFAHAGVKEQTMGRMCLGGPLMGIAQHSLDVPVLKRTRSVFAAVALRFAADRTSRFYRRSACVRCGKCVDVCPAGIPPNLITGLIDCRRFDDASGMGLFSCLECGLCAYVCPSIIPLAEIIRLGKLRLAGQEGLLAVRACKTIAV